MFYTFFEEKLHEVFDFGRMCRTVEIEKTIGPSKVRKPDHKKVINFGGYT